jgi:hypothetical protein
MKKNLTIIVYKSKKLSSNFFKLVLLVLIRFYQLLLSPFLGGSCRFYPTCSHYAVDALKTHDLATAIILIVKRLLKCHPFGNFGDDPVPLKLHKNKELH